MSFESHLDILLFGSLLLYLSSHAKLYICCLNTLIAQSWKFSIVLFFLIDRRVSVGDVVVMKDPEKSDNYIVRRLAAIEGYEMVSTDEKDEPFVLDKDECWVLADNENMKPKVLNIFLK